MILSRSNNILGKDLQEFNVALRKLCLRFMDYNDYNENVFVKTAHKSKGEEADTIIIINVNEGVFPVFNPNNDLFELFGHTTIESVEDESKLYYVSLTRAKHNLYILYKESNKSPYIFSSGENQKRRRKKYSNKVVQKQKIKPDKKKEFG